MKKFLKAIDIFLKYKNVDEWKYPFHCEHDELFI